MSDEIEFLRKERQRLRDEFARVGKPLLDQAGEVSKQIENLLRERGELFHIDYMRYGSLVTEESDDLNEAMLMARDIEDEGNGVVLRVYGPDTEYNEREWTDWKDTGE
jgi:hypothetical protein